MQVNNINLSCGIKVVYKLKQLLMKKVFVKPEMKSYKLRGNRILTLSGTPCPPVSTVQECPEKCAYNCQLEDCYSLTGGSCERHCDFHSY